MSEQPVVIFDGVCNFCNGAVNFIIRHDPDARFRFAPVQSDAGMSLLAEHNIGHLSEDTFVLIEGDTYKLRTDAALAIASDLTLPWRLFGVFRYLPSGFRDWFYDLFARNRYRLFGKRAACMVPEGNVRRRFLEHA